MALLLHVCHGLPPARPFRYWLQSFKYMRAVATSSCAWSEYNDAAAKVAAETDPAQRKVLAESLALPARVRLVANATTMMTALQQTVSTPGELGTYMNIESHSLINMLYVRLAGCQHEILCNHVLIALCVCVVGTLHQNPLFMCKI